MSVSSEKQAGFSLLEVLIAIAILAGIATALGPAISAAARASSRIHQNAAFEEDLRSARQFFNDIIVQQIVLDAASTENVIAGKASSLTLTTLDPGDMSPVIVQLTITTDAPRNLVARFATDKDTASENYVLLSDISNAKFEFMENRQWRSAWSKATPPSLIRLSGVLSNKRDERTFVFEAAPQGSGALHCQFDPVSRRCR